MNNLLQLLGGHRSSDLQWVNKPNLLILNSIFSRSLFLFLHPPPAFPAHFWKGSVVWSPWTWAHFVCSERSWALNWLSHFYIIRYWQVGGARRVERGGRGGGFPRSFSPRRTGSKARADGTELIKVLPQCSHLSGTIGGLRFGYKRLQLNVVLSMAVSWMMRFSFFLSKARKLKYLNSCKFQSETKKKKMQMNYVFFFINMLLSKVVEVLR